MACAIQCDFVYAFICKSPHPETLRISTLPLEGRVEIVVGGDQIEQNRPRVDERQRNTYVTACDHELPE
jgi:hypothetical protein